MIDKIVTNNQKASSYWSIIQKKGKTSAQIIVRFLYKSIFLLSK